MLDIVETSNYLKKIDVPMLVVHEFEKAIEAVVYTLRLRSLVRLIGSLGKGHAVFMCSVHKWSSS
jgi:hypothetical protein